MRSKLYLELCITVPLQIHFGDLNLPEKTSSSSSGISSGGSSVGAQKQSASEALEKFFPPRYMESEADPSVLESNLIEKWASLRGKSVHDCVRIYLTCTRKWQFFGAQLFQVQVSSISWHIFVTSQVTRNGLWRHDTLISVLQKRHKNSYSI